MDVLERTRPPAAAAGTSPPRLPYWSALDGLRGLAVLWVLGYHAALDGFDGGYLGVSAFFTLSGFLLTSLALAERSATGGFSLRRFWARRFRRLMPAALLTLAGVVVMGLWVWSADQLAQLRGDVLSALAYVANWRLIFDHQGYAQAFQAPSPVQHFWSLAIEEQFYVLFPLVVGLAFVLTRTPRRALIGVFLAITVTSTLTMALLFDAESTGRAYLGTDTRLAELALGCLLALVVNTRPTIENVRLRIVVQWTGLAALAMCIALWATVAIDTAWLYRGGFAVHALLVTIVLIAAVQAAGPVPRVLGLRPLVALGIISYGVYLFHWPIFLWLTHERTGLAPIPLFGLRFVVTLAVAILSYRLLETPIRRGRRVTSWRPAIAVPVAAALIVGGVVAVTAIAPEGERTALPDATPDEPPPTTDPTPPAEIPDTRVLLVGDSVALTAAVGLDRNQEELDIVLWNRGALGCGVVRGGNVLINGRVNEQHPNCNAWPQGWSNGMAEFDPDVSLLLGGRWDIVDRQVDGRWLRWGTPESDAYVLGDLHLAVDVLGATGAHVVFMTCPYFDVTDESGTYRPEYEPWRIDHWNDLLRQVARERPGEVTVVDVNAKLAPDGEYTSVVDGLDVRGDGVHLTEAGTDWLARWLAPWLHVAAASSTDR